MSKIETREEIAHRIMTKQCRLASTSDVAAYLGLSPDEVRQRSKVGLGPKPQKLCNAYFFEFEDTPVWRDKWLHENERGRPSPTALDLRDCFADSGMSIVDQFSANAPHVGMSWNDWQRLIEVIDIEIERAIFRAESLSQEVSAPRSPDINRPARSPVQNTA